MALYPCPECQKQISEKAKSCPGCGAEFAGVCPECHMFRHPSATSCANCGHPFSAAKLIADRATDAAAAGVAAAGRRVYGKIWFSIWTYLILPAGALLNLFYASLLLGVRLDYAFLLALVLFAIVFIQIAVAIGLAKRRLTAWVWNWFLIYQVCLGFFAPLFDTHDAPRAVIWVPIALVISIAWLIPNHVYWRKRKEWFHEDVSEWSLED